MDLLILRNAHVNIDIGSVNEAHHTCCLHSLRHTACIRVTPKRMALEVLIPSVHDEGKRVNIPSNAHEGQESDPAFHQCLFILFLQEHQRKEHSSFTGKFTSFIIFLPVGNTWRNSLAFSLITATVVSAILRMTGVQSSLPVEVTRLSMAPFITSIPEKSTNTCKSQAVGGHIS